MAVSPMWPTLGAIFIVIHGPLPKKFEKVLIFAHSVLSAA